MAKYKLYVNGEHTETYDSEGMMTTGVDDISSNKLTSDQKKVLCMGYRIVIENDLYELKSKAFKRRVSGWG